MTSHPVKVFAFLAALAVAVLCMKAYRVGSKDTGLISSVSPVSVAQVPAVVRSLRPNYPYSIMPGGVYSKSELTNWNERDGIVREHYAGFDLRNARFVTAERDLLAYASFRKGGKVFWTHKKLRIPRGELLISDGVNLARARCGNRLAEKLPDKAVLADADPPGLELPRFSMDMFQNGLISSADDPEVSAPMILPRTAGAAADVTDPVQIAFNLATAHPFSTPGAGSSAEWMSPALGSGFGASPIFQSSAALTSSACKNCASDVAPTGPPPMTPNPVPEPAFLAGAGFILLLPKLALSTWKRRSSK